MKTIRVVAAVICDSIEHKTKIFSTARGYGEFKGGWEFPGGKVEPGETMAQALARECREELGVTVAVEEPVAQVVHEYPDLTIRLTLLAAVITGGRLQKLEHNDQRWITAAELPQYEFSPADRAFLPALRVM